MGNIIDSLLSGFTKVIADIVGKPLDFLSGKTCSSVCGSTWDLICYIDNFCVANLAKMAAILFLLYLVVVFFYLTYRLGICACVCQGMCRMVWSCVANSFSACESGCMLACNKMRNAKRARQKQKRRRSCDIEDCFYSSSSGNESEDTTRQRYIARSSDSERSFSRRSGDRRKVYLERSLRPRNHRFMVGISRHDDSVIVDRKEPRVNHRHERALDKIKVARTSRFVRKGSGRTAGYRRC